MRNWGAAGVSRAPGALVINDLAVEALQREADMSLHPVL